MVGNLFPAAAAVARVPIWVGGAWPGDRPFRRAARWDGVAPVAKNGPWTVADTAAVGRRIESLRRSDDPFDIAVPGVSDADDDARRQVAADHAGAGATWWIEAIDPWRYGWTEGAPWPLTAMRARIQAGP